MSPFRVPAGLRSTRLRGWGGAVIGGPGTPGKPVPAGMYAKNIRGVNGYNKRAFRRRRSNG
jgi:hypothetical protein